VVDSVGLAVHRLGRAHHASAHGLADGLVPQAHAQDRHTSGGGANQVQADAGPVGIARPRRDDDGAGFQRESIVHGDRVVAMHLQRRAKFAQEVPKVVGEAVVVIDQKQHDGESPPDAGPSASGRA